MPNISKDAVKNIDKKTIKNAILCFLFKKVFSLLIIYRFF